MARKLLIVLAIMLGASIALGQDSRGGRKHRRNGDRASANGAARQTDSRTAAFLRRVDTNGNGMIDEDELSGGAKSIVEGILTRLGIELKYPIALSKIAAAPKGGRHRGSRDDADADSSSQDESSSDDSSATPPANGFATPKPSLPAVPGFGQAGEQPTGSETKSAAASPPAAAATRSTAAPSTKAGDKPAETAPSDSDVSVDAPKRTGPKSGRFLTPKERLSKDLPEWFREKDVNGDAQVDMAEYSDEWTAALVDDFDRYDLNHDGVITAGEYLKADNPRHKSKRAGSLAACLPPLVGVESAQRVPWHKPLRLRGL
jgi:hypothetical protein